MTKKELRIVLLSIALCWSSSYLFIKEIPQEFSAYAYLTLTSGVAALILTVGFHKLFRLLDRAALIRGVILGLLITGNILFEKLGLDYLPASTVSAFASLNIIIVPLILVFRKQFPSRNNIVGILIVVLGLYLANRLNAEGGGLHGMLWAVLSSVMMSLYTVLAADYTRKSDPLLLTVLQLYVTTLVGLALWLVTDSASFASIDWTVETLSYILIIAFFSKAYAYVMLMYTEKYADAISVTVIAATEPIVTLSLAILIPSSFGSSEMFSFRSLLGAVVIAAGAIVAGTDFLSRGKTAAREATPEPSPPPETEAGPAGTASPAQPGAIRPGRRILTAGLGIMLCFAVLGASIHVMEFAGGLSSIRPQNAIPTAAGILAGPIGALACAVGNFIADLFWLDVYGSTGILGFVANFLAAFIPWKVWRALSGRALNAHSWKNLMLFIWAAFLGNIICAWVLSLGLQLFFPDRFQPLMMEVFWNNFVFTVFFGLPFFIVVTASGRGLALRQGFRHLPLRLPAWFRPFWLPAVDSALLLALFFAERSGLYWSNSLPVRVLCLLTAACIILTCFLPPRKAEPAG